MRIANGFSEDGDESTGIGSDIVGLRALTKKLQFLGLFCCDNTSHYNELPAEMVTNSFSFIIFC